MKKLLADIKESIGECYPMNDHRLDEFLDQVLPMIEGNLQKHKEKTTREDSVYEYGREYLSDLTKLEYFAGLALQGLCARDPSSPGERCTLAVYHAKLMLKLLWESPRE